MTVAQSTRESVECGLRFCGADGTVQEQEKLQLSWRNLTRLPRRARICPQLTLCVEVNPKLFPAVDQRYARARRRRAGEHTMRRCILWCQATSTNAR